MSLTIVEVLFDMFNFVYILVVQYLLFCHVKVTDVFVLCKITPPELIVLKSN